MGQFDKTKPASSDKIRLSDDFLRSNMEALEDTISRNHKFPTGDGVDAGEHLKVVFNADLADPAPGVGKGAVYISTVNGIEELHWQDEGASVCQMTQDGNLGASNTTIVGKDISSAGQFAASVIAGVTLLTASTTTATVAMNAPDHGVAATDAVVNVCYGTGAPPAANTTTIGSIYIKYTA